MTFDLLPKSYSTKFIEEHSLLQIELLHRNFRDDFLQNINHDEVDR